MKRKLLVPIIFSQAIYAQAWTVNQELEKPIQQANTKIAGYNEELQSLCGNGKPLNLEEATTKSNKIWKTVVEQINNARIKLGYNESASLTDRSSISIGKDSVSETSVSGKYAGIDKWRVSVGASLLNTEFFDIGLSGTREVTFIQQFPDRCKSLVRVAYDPVTKIPLNSDRALNRLNPGDFVAFSSPLTLGFGKGLGSFIQNTDLLKSVGGFNFYATGEFNIHVYRMDNNYVRVRFFASKTKGGDINPGLKLYVLGLKSLTLIEGQAGMSFSNLFSADYIFNLNDPEARAMYNRAMGEKFDLTKVTFEGINPFEKDNSVQKRLFSDLGEIEKVSMADLSRPLEARRVIRLSKGDTETDSIRHGFGINLYVLKGSYRKTDSDSLVSFFDVTNDNQKYIIKSISEETKYNIFQLWGNEDSRNTALLVRADDKFKPLYPTGLQTIRVKEELSLSKNDIQNLKSRLSRLPKEIADSIVLPDPEKLKGPIAKARIEQSIFIDAQMLQAQQSITYQAVQDELKKLIAGWGRIESKPVHTNFAKLGDSYIDPRAAAWNEADAASYRDKQNLSALYLEVFDQELNQIPTYLSGLFGDAAIQTKLEYYDKLQSTPLFNEMGITLVLNLIENSDKNKTSNVKMKDAVSYRLSITGRGISPKITEYPSDNTVDQNAQSSENLKKSEIFRRILNDNSYQIDRSFNLRYYMNDKGDSLPLKEVVERSK